MVGIEDLTRFSRKYETFEQWENVMLARLIPASSYFMRIRNFVKQHPYATLKQARGHEILEIEGLGDTFRISHGVKVIPVHSKYYGFLIQAWSKDPEELDAVSDDLKLKLFELIEKFVGAHEGDWWFGYMVGTESPRVVLPSTLELWGEWQWRAELHGRIVQEEGGRLKWL